MSSFRNHDLEEDELENDHVGLYPSLNLTDDEPEREIRQRTQMTDFGYQNDWSFDSNIDGNSER